MCGCRLIFAPFFMYLFGCVRLCDWMCARAFGRDLDNGLDRHTIDILDKIQKRLFPDRNQP